MFSYWEWNWSIFDCKFVKVYGFTSDKDTHIAIANAKVQYYEGKIRKETLSDEKGFYYLFNCYEELPNPYNLWIWCEKDGYEYDYRHHPDTLRISNKCLACNVNFLLREFKAPKKIVRSEEY